MFGLLSTLGGIFNVCPTFFGMLFGHKWTRTLRRKRVEHGCPQCGGKGVVPYRPEDSAVPTYRQCTHCQGTGEDPNNPVPEDEEGRRRRRKREEDDNAPWLRHGRNIKVVWPSCVRCGAANPNWRESSPGLWAWMWQGITSLTKWVVSRWV